MKKVLLLNFLFLFALLGQVVAQSRTVTGKVTGAGDGAPLPGVSVVVKGTTTGTATSADGTFTLNVPADANTLVFRYIGYLTQEVAATSNNVNVRLELDNKQLAEVVVTGYGVQEKREMTGSSAVVSGKDIENLPVQSFDRALQGRAAGVQVTAASGQPGGAINIRIRGVGSINAGNAPLYIIDGVQVASGGTSGYASSNALASINPNDIESIEVLKDAAAASIYGAQAANGVVLITTKRGRAGNTNFNFSAQEGYVDEIKRLEVLTASEFSQLRYESFFNRYGATVPTNPVRDTREYTNALFGDPATVQNTDWQDVVYQRGRLRTYDLSARGGDEKTKFFIAGSYNFQEGQIKKSDFERGTVRMNVDHKANDKLSFFVNLGFSATKQNGNIADGAYINSPQLASTLIMPYQPIYNEDGSYNAPLAGAFSYNLAQLLELQYRVGSTKQTVNSASVVYEILPSLYFKSFAGVDYAVNQDDNYSDPRIAQNASVGGTATRYNRQTLNWNTNHTLSYSKRFGELHNISGFGGFEYKNEVRETSLAQGQGFPNGLFKSLAQAANPTAVGGDYTTYKLAGYFANAKYDYNNKYFAGATLRYDGSSRFGVDNQWGLFYSGSVAWALSEENFLSDVDFLNNLKVRASYGTSGNSNIGNFDSRGLIGGGGQYVGLPGIRPSQLANTELTWEESRTANVGLDFAIFNNRVSGAVDVFDKRNNRILLNRQLPTDSGFGSISENVGVISNKGIEFELNTVNFDLGGFQWNTSFNYTFLKNEILELNDGLQVLNNTYFVGQPINILRYAEYAGVNPADGRPMYYDKNGEITYRITEDDLKIVGTRYPKSYGGLTNSFSYRGLSLDVFFQGQFGNKTLNNNAYFLANSGVAGYNQTKDQLDRWQKPGDMTSVPRPYEGGTEAIDGGASGILTFTTKQVEDASYVRLKQITLGYSVPSSLVSKFKLSSAKVFVQGLNLATWTAYSGLDPELVGNEIGTYPQGKQMTAGLQIGF